MRQTITAIRPYTMRHCWNPELIEFGFCSIMQPTRISPINADKHRCFRRCRGVANPRPGLALLDGGARLDVMDAFWSDMVLDVSAMLCSAEGDDSIFADRLRTDPTDQADY